MLRRTALLTGALFALAACNGNSPSSNVSTAASASPNGSSTAASPTASPSPVMNSSRLLINGQAVTDYAVTPAVQIMGVGSLGGLSVANPMPTGQDHGYSLTIQLRSSKTQAQLQQGFTDKDFNQAEIHVQQATSATASNIWDQIYDVPSSGITLSLTGASGHATGTVDVSSMKVVANSGAAANQAPISFHFEFDNAIH